MATSDRPHITSHYWSVETTVSIMHCLRDINTSTTATACYLEKYSSFNTMVKIIGHVHFPIYMQKYPKLTHSTDRTEITKLHPLWGVCHWKGSSCYALPTYKIRRL